MRSFHPGWLPTLIVLALLPCLLWLGFWQLGRAEEKRQLLAAFEARRLAAPIAVSDLEQQADLGYVRVRMQGLLDAEHTVLLDNSIRDGQVGVELLQPFYDQPSQRWVLLNRGWLPWPDRRKPAQFSTPSGVLSLTGWVYVPPGEGFLLEQTTAVGWPQLVNRVSAQALWQQLGRAGLPWQVRLDPGPASYRLDWPIIALGVEKHQGYAVQWFALAIALLGMFVYLGIRNAREDDNEFRAEPR